jgi:hypothetical protein
VSPTRWLQLHWDRAAGWSSIVLGAAAFVVGWVGASGTPYPAAQLPYLLSGGLGGLFLLGLGGTLLLSADLRDEWHKLDDIEKAMHRSVEDRLMEATAPKVAPSKVRKLASGKALKHQVEIPGVVPAVGD